MTKEATAQVKKAAEHPGTVLERMLKERGISKRELALTIGEYPQLLGDVTKGKRRMNPSLSIRIGRVLGLDDGCLMQLQTRFDIETERSKEEYLKFGHPNPQGR